MASTIISGLYPPLIETYQTPFIYNTTGKVYFSLSQYNDISDIKELHYTLVYASTSKTAFTDGNSIHIVPAKSIKTDISVDNDYKYYFELPSLSYNVDTYYKIQIRFSSILYTSLTGKYNNQSEYFTDRANYFSEWSTATLIHPLPIVTFSTTNDIDDDMVTVNGKLAFSYNGTYSDYLESYQINYYDDSKSLVYSTDLIYTDSYNTELIFKYTCPYSFEEGAYSYRVTYNTSLGYNNVLYNSFTLSHDTSTNSYIDEDSFVGYVSEINGTINLKVGFTTPLKEKRLLVYRASNLTNFTIYDNIYEIIIPEGYISYTFIDMTAESGIWYKYRIREKFDNTVTVYNYTTNDDGEQVVTSFTKKSYLYGKKYITEEPLMTLLDDAFLVGDNLQLKIKYDPSISSLSFKQNVSTTETLGGKYPIIRANSNLYYRNFSISGLIYSEQDINNFFTSKEEIYGDYIDLYNDYNELYAINNKRDYIYERKFREKVMAFLTNNNAKLFKSPTEGNIIIKLTDVSFSPNQTLGRLIYSFSANAIEIDEYNAENCQNYNIQSYEVEIDDLIKTLHVYNDDDLTIASDNKLVNGHPEYALAYSLLNNHINEYCVYDCDYFINRSGYVNSKGATEIVESVDDASNPFSVSLKSAELPHEKNDTEDNIDDENNRLSLLLTVECVEDETDIEEYKIKTLFGRELEDKKAEPYYEK